MKKTPVKTKEIMFNMKNYMVEPFKNKFLDDTCRHPDGKFDYKIIGKSSDTDENYTNLNVQFINEWPNYNTIQNLAVNCKINTSNFRRDD